MKKNYPYVLQENSYDCGIASLMTCFLNKNLSITKDQILEHLHDKKEGISALALITTSEKLGLKAKGVKCDLEVLKNDFLPVIAHTIVDGHYYHYMVILSLNEEKQRLTILDPALGIKKMSYQEFAKISTKVFIIFENKTGAAKPDDTFFKYLKQLFKEYLPKIRQCLLISFLFLLLIFVFQYWLNILLEIFTRQNSNYLIIFFILFGLIIIFKEIFEFIENKVLVKLQHRLDKKIHKTIIDKLIYLPYSYFLYRSTGELSTNVNDLENFKEIVTQIFVFGIINLVILLMILIVLGFYHFLFPIILLFLTVISFLLTKSYSERLKEKFTPAKISRISYTSNLINTLIAYPTVKGLHIEKRLQTKNNNYYKNSLKYNYNYQMSKMKFQLLFSSLTNLVLFISVLTASYLIINNYLEVSFIILYYNFFTIYTNVLYKLLDIILMYPTYKESVKKVLEILSLPSEELEDYKTLITEIKISNLSYKINDKKIFEHLNFTIHAQERILLRGRSGSGKSTLMKLLMGYLKKDEGNIYYNGLDSSNTNLGVIRKNITYVSQEDILFTDTLYQNLNLSGKSKKEVEQASFCCCLNELFKDSKADRAINYDYFILENGSNLSGGERNRIKIARGLLQASNILILDESFNGLDNRSERKILKRIFSTYKDYTFIIISHHTTNFDLFDQIIDLDKGGIG